jgi:hypothetical protein
MAEWPNILVEDLLDAISTVRKFRTVQKAIEKAESLKELENDLKKLSK